MALNPRNMLLDKHYRILRQLRQGQRRRDEACELLADIHRWFTKGFGTVNPVEAKGCWKSSVDLAGRGLHEH